MDSISLRIIKGNDATSNWLLTTAIGANYLTQWMETVSSTWINYAEKYNLGIAVVVQDIYKENYPKLNGAWQKLLAPNFLRQYLSKDLRCVLIDTDIIIAPGASNIFPEVKPGNIGVISSEVGLPYEADRLRNRISMLRRFYIDNEFPLSSLLNAKPRQIFEWANLYPGFNNYFCSGLLVVDTITHADLLESWYMEAPLNDSYQSIDWGEELWLNYCVQSSDNVQWLDYTWQALWIYEVAALYPFLYYSKCSAEVRSWCLASILSRCNFLHLAGRWESALIKAITPSLPAMNTTFEVFCSNLREHELSHIEPVLRGTLIPPSDF